MVAARRRRAKECVGVAAAMRVTMLLLVLVCLLGADGEDHDKRGKLDAEASAKLVSAIAGLVMLGMGLMALIWLGARFTRRYMGLDDASQPLAGGSPIDPDDWAKKPLLDRQDLTADDEHDCGASDSP